MDFEYDPEADAVYVNLSTKQYASGKDIDDERRIDYAADGTPAGIELLCVSQGVNLTGLPHMQEIEELLEAKGIKTYVSQMETASPNVTTWLIMWGKEVRVIEPEEAVTK